MTNDEKTQYTKDWGARVELGQALQRNLAGAYTAALELLRLAHGGEYSPNGLKQVQWLMAVMRDTNDPLQILSSYLEEAREWADPDYWRKREAFSQQKMADCRVPPPNGCY